MRLELMPLNHYRRAALPALGKAHRPEPRSAQRHDEVSFSGNGGVPRLGFAALLMVFAVGLTMQGSKPSREEADTMAGSTMNRPASTAADTSVKRDQPPAPLALPVVTSPHGAKVVTFPVANQDLVQMDLESFYGELFKHNQGLFLAETHGAAHQHIIKMMPIWAKQGLKQLDFEMVLSADQPVLDRYNSHGDNEKEVREAISRRGFSDSYFELMDAAHKHGVDVFGIDVREEGNQRLVGSNPHWTQTVNTHRAKLKPGEKYMVLGGFMHAGNARYADDMSQGVDQRLGIPTVRVEGVYHPPKDETQVTINDLNNVPKRIEQLPSLPAIVQKPEYDGQAHYRLYLKR